MEYEGYNCAKAEAAKHFRKGVTLEYRYGLVVNNPFFAQFVAYLVQSLGLLAYGIAAVEGVVSDNPPEGGNNGKDIRKEAGPEADQYHKTG